MLVLTRQVGEAIFIGDHIKIRILEIKGSSMRIGIEAPRDVPVHLEEIYHQLQRVQRGVGPGEPREP